MVGKSILHYKIIDKLGEGGMGKVYLAEDKKLNRKVALKFLPRYITNDKKFEQRFRNEARSAAALSHPNIVQVHAIEESEEGVFIVMEYVKGRELKEVIQKEDLTLEEKQRTALHIAKALLAAHQQGIIHRDIKSNNILVDEDNKVKIMDFGLARMTGSNHLTRTGETLGTIAYMSPEQLTGKEADQRSDIWSFGVVLYELLTGELPFHAAYEQAFTYAILEEEFTPVAELCAGLPAHLESIVNRCLEKNPEHRYSSFEEIITDFSDKELHYVKKGTAHKRWNLFNSRKSYLYLAVPLLVVLFLLTMPASKSKLAGWLGVANGIENQSLAVLPFENVGGASENEYFSDGLSEELLNSIAKVEGIQVAGRSSSFQFKGTNPDLKEVGSALGVSHILEGSVRKSGNRLRIIAQLVRADNGFQVWSETYERTYSAENVFNIQDEISRRVLNELKVQLLPREEEKIAKIPTRDTEAYEAYLKGNQLTANRQPAELRQAVEAYRKAIKLDPGFALVHAQLAIAYSHLYDYGNLEWDSMLGLMRDNIDQALLLDSNLGQAYAAMGLYYRNQHDFEKAEDVFKKAHELLPGDPEIMHWYGITTKDEELKHRLFIQAYQIEPLYPIIIRNRADVHYEKGEFDEALRLANKNIELNPNFTDGYRYKTDLLRDAPFGKLDEAFIEAYKAYEERPDNLDMIINLSKAAFDLNLLYITKKLEKEAYNLYPQNLRSSNLRADNLLFSQDYEATYLLMDKFLKEYDEVDHRRSAIGLFRLYMLDNKLEKARAYIDEFYPELSSDTLTTLTDPGNWNLFFSAHVSVLYRKLGEEQTATRLTNLICKEVEKDFEFNGDIKKEKLSTLKGYAHCASTQGDAELAAAIIEEFYFVRKSKASVLNLIDHNKAFDPVRDSREFQQLRARIEKDLQEMRANAVAWLKSEGHWQEEWDSQL